jgi:hypothetical protein
VKQLSRFVVTFCGLLFSGLTAPAGIVINEIHYNPDVKTEPAEFIELYNSGIAPVNLAGWAFTDGINYTFPAVTIPAGGYVVVAQNPAFLQTKFGVAGALGPFNPDGRSGLASQGENITLRNAAGQVEDEVEFRLGFPWPTVGDSTVIGNGNSIELIHPGLDNNLGGSWRSSGGSAGPASSQTLLAAQSSWKYFKGLSEASLPTTLWRQPAFDDAGWSTGLLPIGFGESFTNTPIPDMNGSYSSVFLRKQFTVTDPAQFSRIVLEAQFDDGFKAWINGVRVIDGNANMPEGEVLFSGTAVTAIENVNFVTFNLTNAPANLLSNGLNTIAVQAHNSCLGLDCSSDFFFDARLIGQSGGSTASGPTPGRVNSVFALNAPPQIRQVAHTPEQPTSGQNVLVSAKVTDPDGVASVTLQYQIVNPGSYIELTDPAYTNAANWITLAMADNGNGGDLAAGDDLFTAQIPAAVQTHRRLIRYRITVVDGQGRSVRVPYSDDPQPNFAYFVYDAVPVWQGAVQPGVAGANGTVLTYSTNVMGRLPVYHLIAKNTSVETATWFSRYPGDAYQWGGALVYDGKVYDHIHYRARGGVWRYSMCKNMWKFDFNRGHDFEPRDNWGRKYNTPWTKLNLGASIQQGDFNHRGEQGMFESVGFRLFQLAGVAAPHSSFVTFRVVDDALEASPLSQYEGDFWGVYLAIEQENGRFLDEHGLPDGNLYKMEGGTGELNNLGPDGPVNKSDLAYLQANYSNATELWWRTNWNLLSHYSYQAIVQGIHHYDIAAGKNYFFYRNPETRLWETCTWDLDLTWANNMYVGGQTGGDEPLKSRLLDNFNNPGRLPNINIEYRNRVREIRDLLWNNDQAYALIDEYAALLRGATNVPTILDADRSMWDYNPKMISTVYSENPASKAGQGRFYQWPNQAPNPAGLAKTFDGGIQLMKSYVDYRATNASFSLDTMAADNTRPSRPTIVYTGPSGYPINRLSFRSSAYAGSNPFRSIRWRVGEVTVSPGQPRKYEIETVWDSGPITAFNADITLPADALRTGSRYRVRVLHTDTTGRNSNWSLPIEFTCGDPLNEADLLNHLRITELMFNPAPNGYEYVELYNSSSTITLDLSGVKFTQGIDYTFPQGTMLPPGAYLLVAETADIAAFRAYYGLNASVPVFGPFGGSLNNAGEQLVLRTSAGGTDIVNFNYGDGRGWPPQADGTGHALVLLDSALQAQGSGAGEYAANWRPSTYLRGSPGGPDAIVPPSVLLNEIVAHTDFTTEFDSNDWIELYNASDAPITFGQGWYLTDDGSTYASLKKWAIPANTVIGAKGFVTFDEVTGFHNPTNTGFGLNKGGEEVFLSYLPGNAQDRVVDAVTFKGQENDWSLGRYPDGAAFWFGLTPPTRNSANSSPPDRVVISELMFHPPDLFVDTNLVDNSFDEFIELHNATAGPVTLDNTNGTWRFNGGVEFMFPTNLTLAANESLLVVSFNPATNAAQVGAFKALYGIVDSSLRIVGPYNGKLANNSDRIALEKPQHPDGATDPVSWVIVDEVIYADQAPWPCGGDGTGNSLQRLSSTAHGSDPANWSAEPPTSGRPRENLPPGLPAITAQPQDRIVATNANASFSVSVCGTPPFTFQWSLDGVEITGATNATLNLLQVSQTNAGLYTVVVSNPAGSLTSEAASLIVQLRPFIIEHPEPVIAIRDQSAEFSVTVGGTAPFSYQWRFGLANIPGATNRVLLLSNIQSNQAGAYSVLVFNTAGGALSSEAILTVLIPATITQPPTNRTQRVTINPNGFFYDPTNVTMTVGAVGTGLLRYQWRFNGVDLPGATASSHTVSNVTPASEGAYTVVVNDNIGPAVSPPAVLTVLVPPVITQPLVAQRVVAGSDAILSISILAYPPPFTYEWRKGSVAISTNVSNLPFDFFTLTNVQISSTGSYRVALRNAATSGQGLGSPTVPITLLADTDGDGIPDEWESSYGNDSTNLNATADLDGDGMKNWEEFVAGTDPTNALSFLKVETIGSTSSTNLQVQIEFNAVSNRTYTVLSSQTASGGVWSRVADVVAAGSNRTVRVFDQKPAGATARFYRLTTPKHP